MIEPSLKANVRFGNIKKLVELMSDEYNIRVGILGDNGSQEIGENMDMAGLGAVHEFGAEIPVTPKMRAYFRYHFGVNLKQSTKVIRIPARSFLRLPLEQDGELRKKVKNKVQIINNNDVELAEYLVSHGDKGLLDLIANAVGLSAWEQVQEAFRNSGFGEWQANSPLTVREKGSSKPLIGSGKDNKASGRLQNSITFEIKKKGS